MIVHFFTIDQPLTYKATKSGLFMDSEYFFDVDFIRIKDNVFSFESRHKRYVGSLETHVDDDYSLINIEDSNSYIEVSFEDLESLEIDGFRYISALDD